MKTFVVEMFNNLYTNTVADVHMESTDLTMNATNKPSQREFLAV